MKPALNESDLASRVALWLQDQGFDIFQEVQLHRYGPRADLVGRRGSVLAVVETKLHFGERVIQQAQWWEHEAHMVYIAVLPYRGHQLLEYLCRCLGIGLLIVGTPITEAIRPTFRRRVGTALASGLRDEHRTYAKAGNAQSQYWTPFRATCQALASYVKDHEGATLKEAMSGIDHHYASPGSARGTIRKWVELGRVPGVRAEWDGRRIRLFPKPPSESASAS